MDHWNGDWDLVCPETGFEARFGVLPGEILLTSFAGYARLSETERVLARLESILSSDNFTSSSFVMISDFSRWGGSSWQGRRRLSTGFKELFGRLGRQPSATYFCGASPKTKTYIVFSSRRPGRKQEFVDSVEAALKRARGDVIPRRTVQPGTLKVYTSGIEDLVAFIGLISAKPIEATAPHLGENDPLAPVCEALMLLRSEMIEQDAELSVRYRELLAARHAAEEASIAKRAFLANMSHEIRTPLNGVIGIAEILASMPASPEQERYLKILSNEAGNMLELVNGILDFSKIEAGRMQIERIPFDLVRLVDNLADSMSIRATKAGLEFLVNKGPSLPRWVWGDPTRLRQVLTNLAGNAVKFTSVGSVTLSLAARGNCIAFEIKDTGVGIPPERQKAVFSEFEQVDSSTSRQFGGTGLGGSIASNLVKLMGSTIEIESAPGLGTTMRFEIELPLASPDGIGGENQQSASDPDYVVPVSDYESPEGDLERASADSATGNGAVLQCCPADLAALGADFGEVELAVPILRQFLERAGHFSKSLEMAKATCDWGGVERTAKELEAGAVGFHARPLAAAAGALANASRFPNDADWDKVFSCLYAEVERLSRFLASEED